MLEPVDKAHNAHAYGKAEAHAAHASEDTAHTVRMERMVQMEHARPDSPRPDKSHFKGFMAALGLNTLAGIRLARHTRPSNLGTTATTTHANTHTVTTTTPPLPISLTTIHEERDSADTCRMFGMLKVLQRAGRNQGRSSKSRHYSHRRVPLLALWETVEADSNPREEKDS